MDGADVVPQHGLEAAHPVAGGVGGDLGLVDGDGRDAQILCGEHAPPSQDEG